MEPSRLIIPAPARSAVAPSGEAATLMTVISRAAADPDFDIGKMERLMQMHQQIQAQKALEAYNSAMSAAQAEMGPISTDALNPQTKSHYASYAQLDRALRPIYTKHGFALSFNEGETDKPAHCGCFARSATPGATLSPSRKTCRPMGKARKVAM